MPVDVLEKQLQTTIDNAAIHLRERGVERTFLYNVGGGYYPIYFSSEGKYSDPANSHSEPATPRHLVFDYLIKHNEIFFRAFWEHLNEKDGFNSISEETVEDAYRECIRIMEKVSQQ